MPKIKKIAGKLKRIAQSGPELGLALKKDVKQIKSDIKGAAGSAFLIGIRAIKKGVKSLKKKKKGRKKIAFPTLNK